MKTSQNPFSVNDLLAYLVPGLLAILGTHMILMYNPDDGGYTNEFWQILDIKAFNVQSIIPLIIVAYLAGHFLSYMSAIIIEKFSIWSINYPTYYLLEKIIEPKKRKGWQKKIPNSFLFLVEYFTPVRKPNKWIYFLRFIILLFLLPLALPLILTSCLFNTHTTIRKPLDKKLAKLIFKGIKKFFKDFQIPIEKEDIGSFDYFRPINHYVIEHCPEHNLKIQNYVALYGFNRNITLMFIFFFWLFTAISFINGGITLNSIIVSIGLMSCCLIFYAAFNKFYRRFSLEVLMALTANCDVKKQNPGKYYTPLFEY